MIIYSLNVMIITAGIKKNEPMIAIQQYHLTIIKLFIKQPGIIN